MEDQTPSTIPAVVFGLLRTLGAAAGGYLIGKGYITAEQAPQIGGALLALIVAGFSAYQKYRANKALKAAVAAPSGQLT